MLDEGSFKHITAMIEKYSAFLEVETGIKEWRKQAELDVKSATACMSISQRERVGKLVRALSKDSYNKDLGKLLDK